MTQGYVITAVNTADTDYVTCARVLAKSIRLTGDRRPICLITDTLDNHDSIFDSVVLLQDEPIYGPYSNDRQVYQLSPYDQTLKIEADVIVTHTLDGWWHAFNNRDLVIATGCRDYRNQTSTNRYYRHTLDKNRLPDVYNGLTYFKKSALAQEFYTLVGKIFANWTEINNGLQHPSEMEYGDTDTVYAIAASIIGRERCTTNTHQFQWVHMKQKINNLLSVDWTRELVWELGDYDFRINTFAQMKPVHYHIKEFALLLEPHYDKQLKKV